jgi:hypothetical protein
MEWDVIEESRASDPEGTLIRADQLLTEVLRAEGCSVDDEAARHADLALMHPTIAEEYRMGNDVLDRLRLGLATRDECHHAVSHYSRIFETVLGTSTTDRLRKVS